MTLMMLYDAIGIYWGLMWAEGGPGIFSPLIKPSRPVTFNPSPPRTVPPLCKQRCVMLVRIRFCLTILSRS